MKLTSTNRLRLVAITLTTFLTLGIGSFASVSTFKGDQGRIDSQVNETIQAAKENVGQELSAALFYIDQYSLDLSLLLLSRDGQLTLISESTKEGLERLSLSEANRAVREIYDARGKSHLRLRTLEISGGDYLVVVGSAEDAYKRLQSNIATSISITVVANLGAFIILSFYIRRIKKRDDVDALARMREFLGDASHELRTPLTTLRMASEVIHSSKDNFDPIVARSAELLVAQLDRFERLLEELLEVSRFDAEVAVLEAVDFDIVQLVQRCADDLSLVAKERKTEIYVKSSTPVVMIKADIRRVERILRNLLANAIDHAEEMQIDVRIESSEHDVAVGVRDYGVGLDENALIRVFDRFWRADPSRARTRGGTGLGLSIALEDARLHNGELEAWGRPGRGAHFVMTLPRSTWERIDQRLIPLQPEDYKA